MFLVASLVFMRTLYAELQGGILSSVEPLDRVVAEILRGHRSA